MQVEQIEDRQRWLASADAARLAAAVRQALDAHDAGENADIVRAFTASEIETIFALGLEQWQQMIKSIHQTNQETEK